MDSHKYMSAYSKRQGVSLGRLKRCAAVNDNHSSKRFDEECEISCAYTLYVHAPARVADGCRSP